MSSIIDKKFIGLISGRLRNVTYKNSGSVLASFSHSCERANSHKKRGHFLLYKGVTFFRCFNCGESMSLSQYIKSEDPVLFREYALENFKEGVWDSKPQEPIPLKNLEESEPVPNVINHMTGLLCYDSLKSTNPALKYVVDRMIPTDRYSDLYLAPKFYEWAGRIDPVFKKFTRESPRLVLPYHDRGGNLLGFTCRAFGKELPKYIHLRLDKDKEFIYGANRVDTSSPIIVLEGQLDSLFLDNAVGVGRASYDSAFLSENKTMTIIVPDNDWRRNIHVCNQLKRAILCGQSVSILPDYWKKDINDIIRSGINKSQLMEYIISHKKSGPAAELELALERKC